MPVVPSNGTKGLPPRTDIVSVVGHVRKVPPKQTSTRDCDVRSVAQGWPVHQEGLLKNYARRPLAMGLQMSVAEYASYDAVGLAELVRKREVSPTELVEAAIERIEKHRMRQPFPKLRLCPILKASCSSLRPARARPAVRRRGPLRPRPLRLHQDLGAASCCP